MKKHNKKITKHDFMDYFYWETITFYYNTVSDKYKKYKHGLQQINDNICHLFVNKDFTSFPYNTC